MLKEYLSALFHGWVGKMSGLASIVITFLPLILPRVFAHTSAVAKATWGAAVLCFLIANYAAWKFERDKNQAFINPTFRLKVEGIGTLQRDSQIAPLSWDARYWRIAVMNESPITLKQCEVILESWTFASTGLNSDTALSLKDKPGTAIDIPSKDRKQFNFLLNIFDNGTDNLNTVRVHVPNRTTVSSPPGGYSAVLRIIGENMDTRRYKALLLIDDQGIRITNMMEA